MKITADEVDQQSLSRLGEEAVALLNSRNFEALAERFGYALAYGREPAKAIEADLAACLSQGKSSYLDIGPSIAVKYFDPHDANLVAVVECVTRGPGGSAVLVELIVISEGTERHVTLEDISPA